MFRLLLLLRGATGKKNFVAILRDTMGFFCFVGLFFAPFRPNQGKQRERQAVWLAFFVLAYWLGFIQDLIWMAEVCMLSGFL